MSTSSSYAIKPDERWIRGDLLTYIGGGHPEWLFKPAVVIKTSYALTDKDDSCVLVRIGTEKPTWVHHRYFVRRMI